MSEEKSAATEMPTTYDPKAAEQKWYSTWTERGYFKAGQRKDAEPFTIVIPPRT